MTGLRAASWPDGGQETPSRGLLDQGAGLAAIVLLVASAAGVWQQSLSNDERSTAANAAVAPERTRALGSAPTREWMIGAYRGAQYTYPSDISLKNPPAQDFTAKQVEWAGEPFKNPIYYGARVVRWFEGGQTGAMLDFTHSKVLANLKQQPAFSGTLNGAPAPARAVLGDIFRRLEFTHGHNMLTLNGLWRLPSIMPRLSPYVGVGAGISLPHTEVQTRDGPPRTYEYQFAGPAAQALVGLELRFGRMSYFVEYKFTFARYEAPLTHRDGDILFVDLWRQLQRWLSGEQPPGGFIATLLSSHQLIAGLGVRVASAPAAGGS